VPPHEPEAGCVDPAELRGELDTIALAEKGEQRRGRAYLRIPPDWVQDPRLGPEDVAADVALLERMGA
jgi:hypothetical protein